MFRSRDKAKSVCTISKKALIDSEDVDCLVFTSFFHIANQ